MQVVAEDHPLITCSISFVLRFCAFIINNHINHICIITSEAEAAQVITLCYNNPGKTDDGQQCQIQMQA